METVFQFNLDPHHLIYIGDGNGKSAISVYDTKTGKINFLNVQIEDIEDITSIIIHESIHKVLHEILKIPIEDNVGFDELLKNKYRLQLLKIILENNKKFLGMI